MYHWSLVYSYKLTVSNGRVGLIAFGIYVCSGLYIFLYFDSFKWARGVNAFGIYVCIGL